MSASCLSLAAALLLGFTVVGQAAPAAGIQPYRAVYSFSMDPGQDHSDISSYRGRREMRLTMTCDSVDLDQSEWRTFTLASGPVVTEKVAQSMSETADGRVLTYRLRTTPANASNNVDSVTRLDESGRGTVTFAKGAQSDVTLPEGTVLPLAYQRQAVEAMLRGERSYAAAVYGGWGNEPTSVSTTFGSKQPDDSAPGALLRGAWYDVTSDLVMPVPGADAVRMTRRGHVYENGVSDRIVSSSGVTVIETLEQFEPLPMPSCR